MMKKLNVLMCGSPIVTEPESGVRPNGQILLVPPKRSKQHILSARNILLKDTGPLCIRHGWSW